jgi:hypothetical protein
LNAWTSIRFAVFGILTIKTLSLFFFILSWTSAKWMKWSSEIKDEIKELSLLFSWWMAIDHRLRIGIFPKIARCPISVQDCVFLNAAARRQMGIVKNLQKIAIQSSKSPLGSQTPVKDPAVPRAAESRRKR